VSVASSTVVSNTDGIRRAASWSGSFAGVDKAVHQVLSVAALRNAEASAAVSLAFIAWRTSLSQSGGVHITSEVGCRNAGAAVAHFTGSACRTASWSVAVASASVHCNPTRRNAGGGKHEWLW
jgi:hypothetical protein